jgi:transporter family protein
MEKGLIFALLASLSFAVSAVSVRRASARTGETFTATAMSVLIGVPFLAIALCFAGEWQILGSVSWRDLILLGAAGIIHFLLGRLLSYNGYRLLGANRGATLSQTALFYTVILSVIFLKESLTVYLVLGVLSIFAGSVLVTTERRSTGGTGQSGTLGTRVKGTLNSLGGALCWGISPILIKPALGETGSPVAGAFVSYAAAFVIVVLTFCRRQPREQMSRLPFKEALVPLLISAIFASAGQFFLYIALDHSPASMVTPLVSTHVMLVFLLSLVINRSIEIFTPKVILAMVLTVAGTFLVFQ